LLFLSKQEVLDIHAKAIGEFGGSLGLRDEGALESALAAAEQRHFYENADLATCAATYAFHLSKAHAFVDGNKRTALLTALTFLKLNGHSLHLGPEWLDIMVRVAADETMQRADLSRAFAARMANDENVE